MMLYTYQIVAEGAVSHVDQSENRTNYIMPKLSNIKNRKETKLQLLPLGYLEGVDGEGAQVGHGVRGVGCLYQHNPVPYTVI